MTASNPTFDALVAVVNRAWSDDETPESMERTAVAAVLRALPEVVGELVAVSMAPWCTGEERDAPPVYGSIHPCSRDRARATTALAILAALVPDQ